ncbi:hypothetical protein EDB89DRAFT_2070530 [Lactarius sanguifluus]|nr:hypothetical protein EDB89DRAFT_2070530 [Lactarius sanguifluus]
MYYNEDDDPYAPRIGLAAMPSPRSKFAPYYLGHANMFEDFLEEFEGLASNCELTDPQRVDVLICYVAPSLRDFWRSLDGYRSRDWPLFRQSLVNIFGNPTPRHQIMRQKLRSYVQDSARKRMYCEDNVLQYYRQFICFGLPLVHAGHLSEEERDAAFWYGFHPDDREVLRPRLLGKNPLQPPDVPFHFEDVFRCARAAFAYDNYFPSPWSQKLKFEPSSIRRDQPVTTTIPDELSPSSQSHVIQPPSSSPSASESHQTQAPSVTVDQPKPAHTFSTTLFPSASPSHTSSPVHLATDNDLIPVYTFPITTSTLPPSVSPTPSHDSSLAHLAADENPESTFPSPSIVPAPLSMPTSDFEYLPSTTVNQPEPAPTLSSTPPCLSSISSTLLPFPACLAAEHRSEPELAPTLFASVPTPSHVHSATDYGTIFASTPPSLSPTSSTFVPFPVRSAMNNQPESEHEAASTVPLLSLPLSTLHPLSPLSSTFLPSVTEDQSEPEHASSSSITPTTPSLPAPSPALRLEFTDDVCELLSLPPTPQSASLARSEVPTSLSSPTRPSPSENPTLVPAHLLPSLHPSPEESCCNLVLEPLATPASSYPHVSPSSLGELIPLLPGQHKVSVTVPTLRHSTLPQQLPGFKTVGSDCSTLEVTPAPTSPTTPSVPQPRESPLVYYEVSSMLAAPRFSLTSPPLPLSCFGLAHNFALAIIIATAFVSTLINLSKTLLTHLHKFQSNDFDLDTSRPTLYASCSTPEASPQVQVSNYLRHAKTFDNPRRRHAVAAPRSIPASPIPVPIDNLVFNPGGVAFVLEPAHEDSATFDKDVW